MRVHLEPTIADWPEPDAQRPVVTGHQQSLFHPGILAKYVAGDVTASGRSSSFAQVVVDQDVYDPLAIALPMRMGDRLSLKWFRLGRVEPDVPPGSQPAVAAGIHETLAALPWPVDAAVSRAMLSEVYQAADGAKTLARQAWRVHEVLMAALGITTPATAFACDLLYDEAYAWVMEQLLHDALSCARRYNDAVQQFPGAGIAPLRVEPDRVETPLWRLGWMQPRQRVYVDIADSTPIFVTEDGEPIAAAAWREPGGPVGLAPRALLMTALLRSPERCAAFIHGKGGWVYDRITEQWWEAWRGATLAPMTMASADFYLDFDLPVNGRVELERAIWRRHHVKDNVDRALLPGASVDVQELIRNKRELLAHMDDDRDKARRRAAFDEVHRINAALRDAHSEVIDDADIELERARVGVANRAIAQRRDWFYGLYPQEKLDALRDAVVSQLATSGARATP